MSFVKFVLVGFLFGIGFGYFVQRAGLCFANGLGEIFIGMGKNITRLFIVIFIITSAGFLFSGYISNGLGPKAIGQIRGYGFYNLLAGGIFGAGIFLCGGCILGTMRQMGEGNMLFLIVLISFIPGMAVVVYILNPLLQDGYNIQKTVLSDMVGISPLWITGSLILLTAYSFYALNQK